MGDILSVILRRVHVVSDLKKVGEEDEQVDEYFVCRTFNFKVFEKNVDAKHSESLINDVLLVASL